MTTIEGFVPLASYDDEGRSRQSGHSPQWKMLREAIDAGEIDGFQHGGSKRWLVNKRQADRLIVSRIPPATQEPDDGPYGGKTELDCLVSIGETLSAILDLLREQTRRSDKPQWHPQIEDEVTI